ncbi:MAG: hypothetical protein EOO33_05845 [Comamonadaceae bacterium]|nr:MAG: hypothetical protein EOO33_05845 [Comamonadaceae bacterium]
MIDQLDSCKYLYLRSIDEPQENSVRFILEEARSSDVAEDLEFSGVDLGPSRRIVHDDACRVFEVVWHSYISYAVTNESYQLADDPETFSGQRVRRYTRSPFLEYVARSTFASSDYPGPFEHIGVTCLNHGIDVVSTEAPQVRLLKNGRPLAVKGPNAESA